MSTSTFVEARWAIKPGALQPLVQFVYRLWLGHASIQNTEIYLRADPTEKLDALAMGIPPALKRGKFQVPDKLMAMFKEVGKAR